MGVEGKPVKETEKKNSNKESKEHQEEIELHGNDLGLEDSSSSSSSPRGVLGNTAMTSDTDNNSSSYSSCSSFSSDDKSSPSSASSPVSNTPNKNVSSSSHSLQWNKMIESIKKKSIRRLTAIPFLASYKLTHKNLRCKQPKFSPSENCFFMAKPSWRNFTYEELAAATEDFNPENMIGKGGHAEVYKGVLPDGETVAIKKVMSHDKEEEERVSDFLSELGIIAHVNHINAARLRGFSIDRGLHFVLEYMAPEYFIHGIVDEKIDVFSFGVLLLEIITGRRAVDAENRQSIVAWAKPFLEKNSVEDIVDPRLGNEFDPTEMKRVMLAASMCIHHIDTMRPDMTRLVQLLRGEDGPAEQQQKSDESVNACDLQDHTSSSYLNELTRHRQLLME
ncbi:hypothetical protein Bca101_024329 [Brassica carinata]